MTTKYMAEVYTQMEKLEDKICGTLLENASPRYESALNRSLLTTQYRSQLKTAPPDASEKR